MLLHDLIRQEVRLDPISRNANSPRRVDQSLLDLEQFAFTWLPHFVHPLSLEFVVRVHLKRAHGEVEVAVIVLDPPDCFSDALDPLVVDK